MDEFGTRLEERALAPLGRARLTYYLLILGLLGILGFGLYAYSTQLSRGLSVTGMASTGNKVMWGLYITNFVFFIGISHAGTLISAILRVTHAGWRTPITRMAELITVVALSVAALLPIVDLGRPDRVLNVMLFGRWQSPLLWDVFAITTYLVGSLIYLYLPLVPDLAVCRDRLDGRIGAPQRWFYRTFALGWTATPNQRRHLLSGLGLMMILIIPVAVSVHTVVSWVFAMTLRTGWNTAVFGAYFVAGAIFSGIAVLILLMAVLRKALHLEEFITLRHFVNLGYLMAALALVMVYFNISESLTAGYKLEGNEPVYLGQIFTGTFAPFYWSYVAAGLLLPCVVMLVPRLRRIATIVFAALLVTAAMWVERYIIVVASLKVPQMPYTDLARYFPTWVEVAITGGAIALFSLIIAVAVRVIPAISIWEVRERHEEVAGVPEAAAPQPVRAGQVLGP
jgi:molybdopterin-containing oxidoreductase family membrane subunit